MQHIIKSVYKMDSNGNILSHWYYLNGIGHIDIRVAVER